MSVQFKDNSINIKTSINQASLNWLEEASSEIESQAIDNTRVDSGNTSKGWQHIIDESYGKAYIGNSLANALWEEFGTGEFATDESVHKNEWYVPVDWVTGSKKPTYNGKVTIVYGKDGTAFYKTNGKKPTYALTKAFETKRKAIIESAKQKLGGI